MEGVYGIIWGKKSNGYGCMHGMYYFASVFLSSRNDNLAESFEAFCEGMVLPIVFSNDIYLYSIYGGRKVIGIGITTIDREEQNLFDRTYLVTYNSSNACRYAFCSS